MQKKVLIVVTLIGLLVLTSCRKPVKLEKFVTVEPHETAFLIPLDEDSSGQKRIMSEKYLIEHMVSAKRISLPQREKKIGRYDHEIEWIPSMRVIKVDRTPVTREWTESPKTGTSNHDDAILVESKDSIAFRLGVTISVSIKAENTAKFLYNFNGKNLKEIVDTNIRGLVQNVMSREFNKMDLTTCKKSKGEVISVTLKEVRDFFLKKGITVEYIGLASGMVYEDKEIQTAINKKFIAENRIEIVMKELESKKEENKIKLQNANNEIAIAKSYSKNMESIIALKRLEYELKKVDTLNKFIDKWDGKLPSRLGGLNQIPILRDLTK